MDGIVISKPTVPNAKPLPLLFSTAEWKRTDITFILGS